REVGPLSLRRPRGFGPSELWLCDFVVHHGKSHARLPLWVKSRHRCMSAACPLYPQKRTLVECLGTVQRFFSASSRNSSGTDRDSPNMTDPYPTASHPKRSRIRSMARSAVHRAIPLLVPGRRFSSSSPSGNSSCTFQCFSRCDTEIASSEMLSSSG